MRRPLGLALAVLAAGATGCGGGDHDMGGGEHANAADAAFVTEMVEHHQGAIDMAALANRRAEHPEIRRLAADITKSQKAEISAMEHLGEEMHVMGEHGDGHEGMGMSDHEMGMDMDMSALRRARPFDRAFIDAMIPHHEGGITMAKRLLEKGRHADLKRVAKQIIGAQTREIRQMRAWRAAWYGS
jgi:uncharacterized protein (DUF305 family)